MRRSPESDRPGVRGDAMAEDKRQGALAASEIALLGGIECIVEVICELGDSSEVRAPTTVEIEQVLVRSPDHRSETTGRACQRSCLQPCRRERIIGRVRGEVFGSEIAMLPTRRHQAAIGERARKVGRAWAIRRASGKSSSIRWPRSRSAVATFSACADPGRVYRRRSSPSSISSSRSSAAMKQLNCSGDPRADRHIARCRGARSQDELRPMWTSRAAEDFIGLDERDFEERGKGRRGVKRPQCVQQIRPD